MKTSENIDCLAKAMVALQSEMGIAVKENKAYHYKYADLAGIWSVIRAPLTSNGLTVMQDALSLPEGVSVVTRVMHTSGQWIDFGPLMVPMAKIDAHSTGSACTYGRRYALCAALGVVTDDDDGQAAMKPAAKPEAKACSDAEYESFLVLWSENYDRKKLTDYVEKRSNHFSMTTKQTVHLLTQDIEKFEREFLKWLEKNPPLLEK